MASSDDERQIGDQEQITDQEQVTDQEQTGDQEQPGDQPSGPGNRHHSGGPRSEAGLAASSQNSTKHGILSEHLILRGENPADFAALLEQLREALDPVGAFEAFQVERIAVGIWRQRRLVRAETEQLEHQWAQLRADERRFVAESVELLVQQADAGSGSGPSMAQTAAEFHGQFQAEYVRNGKLIENATIEDLEKLADKAPNIVGLLLVEAEKKGVSVVDILNDYESIAEWVKATIAIQKQAKAALAGISAQGAAVNSQAKDAPDASKKMEKSAEKNTANEVMQSRWIPANMEVLGRYQTMLDNQITKAMKALFDAQEARRKANEYTDTDKVVAVQKPGK